MLIRWFQKIKVQAHQFAKVEAPANVYYGAICNSGYVFRKEHAIWFDHEDASVVFTVVLAHPTADSDVLTYAPVAQVWRDHVACLDPLVTNTKHAAVSETGPCYCGCRRPSRLIVQCDPLSGAPPIICADERAYVAPYRLGLPEDLSVDLRRWDELYDSVFQIWYATAELEEWSKAQIEEENSVLNTLGRSLAERIAAQVGIEVMYWMSPKDEVGS